MYYVIDNGEVREAVIARMNEDIPSFGYITLDELKDNYDELGLPYETVIECASSSLRHRTSMDTYDEVSFGIVSMLDMKNIKGRRDRIGFYIKRGMFILVRIEDEDDSVGQLFSKAVKKYEKNVTLEKIICSIMELLLDGSAEALEKIEERTTLLEARLVNGSVDSEINREIFRMRNELTIQKHYYEQLIDIGEAIQQDANNVFEDSELRYIGIFTAKAGRLSDNTQVLNENLVHLREALNAALDYNLNRIMKIFTVVTTIFLPLTLIAGWYGMNFKNMPELYWDYGYQCVIALSVIVVVACIIFFKKKKFM